MHHAEIIAAKVGEPLGSIVLALAVTVLEVGLILSLMLGAGDGGATIARDTVYSAIMIITTGIVGLSLLFGSRRHHEQTIRIRGTSSALSVLSVLAVITLILPNFTVATHGPTFSTVQLLMVAITSLVLYCAFLFVQTVRHREYFLPEDEDGDGVHDMPSQRTFWSSAVLLCVALAAVILLAKSLSPVLAVSSPGRGCRSASPGRYHRGRGVAARRHRGGARCPGPTGCRSVSISPLAPGLPPSASPFRRWRWRT